MESGEHEMVQIKRESESDAFEEVFDRSRVKDEPCHIGKFSETGMCDGSKSDEDLIDNRTASVKYEEQEDENYSTVELNSENADVTDLSTTRCNAEQIKSEDNIDIHYNDVKPEIDEKKPGDYRLNAVCNKNDDSETNVYMKNTSDHVSNSNSERGEDMAQTMKSPFLHYTAGTVHEMTLMQKTPGKSEEPFQCRICSKTFTKPKILKVHEKIHTGEKPFQCKICSKAFVSSSQLKMHERINTGEKPFQCKICSKDFTQSSDLKVHERIHTCEKPFQCKNCSKAFTQLSSLNAHERIHTGEKPFQCKICYKAFTQSGGLKVHATVHTGAKPFNCKNCSKAFTCASSLKIHENFHTGNKPFQCKICSKAFTQKHHLKTHERIHTGDKPFLCKICQRLSRALVI